MSTIRIRFRQAQERPLVERAHRHAAESANVTGVAELSLPARSVEIGAGRQPVEAVRMLTFQPKSAIMDQALAYIAAFSKSLDHDSVTNVEISIENDI